MVEIRNLGTMNSVFNQFMAELRSAEIQKDAMRFRRNVERMGEIMAYELSKEMSFTEVVVRTPLGECDIQVPESKLVLATVLRAGLPMHRGLLNYFDKAENAFVSAYRFHLTPDEFEVKVEYLSSPDLKGKDLILCDPMLATGQSMKLSLEALLEGYGTPRSIHLVSLISSQEGIDFIKDELKVNAVLWTGAIDSELTAQAYIVPGLGDAGDLAYGVKE